MNTVQIEVMTEDVSYMPTYGSEEAAGADLRAAIEDIYTLHPGESKMIPTGIRLQIPRGYEVQIRPRSGLALKHQITVLNTPGTIDSDYRGEICVILINHGKQPFSIEPKMRIAQMVVAPVYRAQLTQAQELSETKRGSGGFGHTGAF